MYFAFCWLDKVSFPFATGVWAAAILAGVLLSSLTWGRSAQLTNTDAKLTLSFVILLGLQFPTLFAMERGNCDVVALVAWTGAAYFWFARRPTFSGLFAGLAVAFKIYPVFACLVVGGGLAARSRRYLRSRRHLWHFALGSALAMTATTMLLLAQLHAYIAEELPTFAAQVPEPFRYAHTLRQIDLSRPWIVPVLGISMLAGWIAVAARRLEKDPVLVFAGGLAISTFFANTSYDYNLITTYPLLVTLFLRALQRSGLRGWFVWGLLMLGLYVMLGNHGSLKWPARPAGFHVVLQWAWLLAVAVAGALPIARALKGTGP